MTGPSSNRIGPVMQYRPHRYPTQFPVAFQAHGAQQKCHIIDINNTGARITGAVGLRRGDKIKFEVLSSRVEAVVTWATINQAGVTFRPHISDKQVDTLRYRRDGRRGGHHSTVGFGFAEMR